MKKKILLILTGGTICSSVGKSGFKDSNTYETVPTLINNFRNSGSEFSTVEFETIFPLDILSENMRIDDWSVLIECFKKIEFTQYKGIILAHGTDTLAYTSALLSLILKGIDLPVVLISSQLPLSEEKSNGNINFKNAVEVIEKGIAAGVYAVYRNDDGISYIHKGQDLKQCFNYSNDFFSKTMVRVEMWYVFTKENCDEVLLGKIKNIKNEVLMIEPYVGIDYSSYSLKGKKIVLHGTYHSSTACTAVGESNVIDFINRCENENVIFLLSSVQPELLENDGVMYSSTGAILSAGAIPITGITSEMAYAKAMIGCALFNDKYELINFLKKD